VKPSGNMKRITKRFFRIFSRGF